MHMCALAPSFFFSPLKEYFADFICRRTNLCYSMLRSTQLEDSFAEKDLGVLVDIKLNVNQQCTLASKKAKSIPGCMRQSITSRSREVILLPYSSLVRLPLKYCFQFWVSQYRRDMDIPEGDQRKANKMHKDIEHFSRECWNFID